MHSQIETEPTHKITIHVREAERKMIMAFLNKCPKSVQSDLVVIDGLRQAFELPAEERPS